MNGWIDTLRMEGLWPVTLAVATLAAATVSSAFLLRRALRRARSLRVQFLAVTLGALALMALAAVLLSWLMVLDAGEIRNLLGVLAVTAGFTVVLVLIASAPLGADARRVETAVRAVQSGHREVRTSVTRADELGQVARAFDELTHRLGVLEAERATFDAERSVLLSSISHDLRTPLAALRAALEALIDGVAPDPDRYLRSMQHDVAALAALIDDLFLLARIESGRLELVQSSIDLAELADEAVEALTPTAAAAGVRLVLNTTDSVRASGNPIAVGRVLRNLVDNAVRHAPAGSVVHIAIERAGRPTIRVVDEGPGFPAEFSDVAFDRFTRADVSRTRATGGAGLGLAIARGLVESLGGRIWIEPPPGGRVAFELPQAS